MFAKTLLPDPPTPGLLRVRLQARILFCRVMRATAYTAQTIERDRSRRSQFTWEPFPTSPKARESFISERAT